MGAFELQGRIEYFQQRVYGPQSLNYWLWPFQKVLSHAIGLARVSGPSSIGWTYWRACFFSALCLEFADCLATQYIGQNSNPRLECAVSKPRELSITRCYVFFMMEGAIIHLLLSNTPLIIGLVKVFTDMAGPWIYLVCLPPHKAHCLSSTSNVLMSSGSSSPISMPSVKRTNMMSFSTFRWSWSQARRVYTALGQNWVYNVYSM